LEDAFIHNLFTPAPNYQLTNRVGVVKLVEFFGYFKEKFLKLLDFFYYVYLI